MTRPTLRRTPVLERLETRQVLSGVADLAADKQYVVELINLVRTDPKAAGEKLTANLGSDVQSTLDSYGLSAAGLKSKLAKATPQPPVAVSTTLEKIAQDQSQYQADSSTQTHNGPGGINMAGRFSAGGYSNPLSEGENTYAYAQSADQAMQSFLFDWGVADEGHYKNLLQPGVSAKDAYEEVGIGLVSTTNGVGPLVLTQDFGSRQGANPQILGVSYNDSDGDDFYTPGEGNGGLTIRAVNLSTQAKYETKTSSAGGYQMPVDPNADYQVSAILNGQVVQSRTIHVGDVNSKTDFVLDPSKVATVKVTPPPATPPPSAPAAPAPVNTVSKPTPTPPPPPPAQPQAPKPVPTPVTGTSSKPTTPAKPSWVTNSIRWKAINYSDAS